MPEAYEMATEVTQNATGRPVELEAHSWPKGVSGNTKNEAVHPLDLLLKLKLDSVDMAAKLVELVEAGDLPAIKYAYDRVAGKPIERHEAKLIQQVDDTAKQLAEAYGMSEAEVRDRAARIAQGT